MPYLGRQLTSGNYLKLDDTYKLYSWCYDS